MNNKKERKSSSKRILISLIIIAMLIASIIGAGALAKYVSSVDGSGSIQVAKWSAVQEITALNNKTYTPETLKADRIAPGTEGEFDVNLNFKGTEVGLDYVVTFSNITNVPANMYFKIGDTKYSSLADVGTALSGHINANDAEDDKEINTKVKWFWDYETTTSPDGTRTTLAANDSQDTTDGENAATMSFSINVTATQARPV